jgi:hypothetical protein
MPRVSAFHGIVISMYFKEDNQFELRRNWALVRASQTPAPVDPLQ